MLSVLKFQDVSFCVCVLWFIYSSSEIVDPELLWQVIYIYIYIYKFLRVIIN